MPIALAPVPGAVERLRSKAIMPTRLSSAEIAKLPLGTREQTIFSARVEQARVISRMKQELDSALSLDPQRAFASKSAFIADMRRFMGAAPGDSGRMSDITSHNRLGLIYDMQIEDAYSHARFIADQDEELLDEFPAQEFLRIESRRKERSNWKNRWIEAGGKIYGGRMIARKGDDVWENLSRFGKPWPPFDYNSGMGVEDVDRAEAEKLGVIQPGEKVLPSQKQFQEKMEASLKDIAPEARDMLEIANGDEVRIDPNAGKVSFEANPQYRTARAEKLPSVAALEKKEALAPAPEAMDAGKARSLMKSGHVVQDYTGQSVSFGPSVLEQWKGYADEAARPGFLPFAAATVVNPTEHWEQETQTVYLKLFAASAPVRGCLVTRKTTGEVKTYFVRKPRTLEAARRGLRLLKGGAAS